ncbi:hypothetical protein [Micromonospora chalcea]|uniref:hypothetical protein n=1 Tax=Micromonospora chalcea TaxID=1874 RepID=UPI00332A00EC
MTGLELVVGYLAAWAWHKARRVKDHADAAVDEALDAGIERLRHVVLSKLKDDPALVQLEREAGDSAEGSSVVVSDRTRKRVVLAIEEGVETDHEFGTRVWRALAEVESVDRQRGVVSVTAGGDHSIATAGDMSGIASTGAGAINIQTR